MALIAFCSRISAEEKAHYIALLSAKLPAHQVLDGDEITAQQASQVEVAVVANPDPSTLLRFAKLRWVQSLWAGVERLIKEIEAPHFALSRLIDPNLAQAMTEASVAWTLYLHREMPTYRQQQVDRCWRALDYVCAAKRRVCVLGLGELGIASAQALAQQGFRVSGWSRSAKTVAGVTCYSGDEGLAEVLPQTDIVLCLLPLTAQTQHLIDDNFLYALPRGAQLINFGRGPVIDDAALLSSLDSGHIKHAVLDVFAQEPLPVDHAMWQHPSVTVLPHISAPTNSESATDIAAANVLRFLESGEFPELVDFGRGY